MIISKITTGNETEGLEMKIKIEMKGECRNELISALKNENQSGNELQLPIGNEPEMNARNELENEFQNENELRIRNELEMNFQNELKLQNENENEPSK